MTTKMTTDKQMAANQANAQKSTGPKTGEGKVNSSMNAVKHGLLAKCALMPGDDVAQFDELRAALHLEFQPYLRAPRENGFVLKCPPGKKSISSGPKKSKGLGKLAGI